jgi:DNA-binding NtrC family response regulator
MSISQLGDHLPVIGTSMAGLVRILEVFAKQEETILISGPTGAGKSRLARWCHEHSNRKRGPFETLDLMMVPEELQMAQLFGWRKGAFTGAVRNYPGSLSLAEGGTLFIDEVDKLSLRAQAGMLHLLEERTYRVLGEESSQRANVRFIVGTNTNLQGAVKAGRFREDLYYRINVLPVQVPSLDARRDEIGPWAQYMLTRRHQERHPAGQASLLPEAQLLLTTRNWPGNLRQLDNIVRRAYSLALLEQGMDAKNMLLHEQHVVQALDYEGASVQQSPSLFESLRTASACFLQEAQRAPTPWDLDLADAFRGFVLGAAIQRFGIEEAFHLLGRKRLLKNRNHYKVLRRELAKVDTLLEAMGHSGSPFANLLDADSD